MFYWAVNTPLNFSAEKKLPTWTFINLDLFFLLDFLNFMWYVMLKRDRTEKIYCKKRFSCSVDKSADTNQKDGNNLLQNI